MSATDNQQIRDISRLGIRVSSSSAQESERMQVWRAAGRALISGYVDSYTLLNFGVLRLLHERQHHFCRFKYWAGKFRRG